MQAQTITTTAGTVTSCPGEIVVPVTVTNCNGIGAISLELNYSNSLLTYVGYQNLNSALSAGMLIINSTGTKVIISWANTLAANIGNGTLVELKFSAISGSSTLNWDTQTPGNCEYSNISGTILAASFVNGTTNINQLPQVTTQPMDKTALVGNNTSFSLSASGTGISYLWQLSTNGGGAWNDLTNTAPYSGVTTPTLNVSNLLLTYSGYKYRCRVTGTCTPVVYSNVVTLTVINPITTTLPTSSFCPGSIVVPVTVTNFTSVASFSLTFVYNPAVLTYTGYQSLNAALSGGTFVTNAIGGIIYLTWSSTTAASIGSGTVVSLLFTNVTGNSNLTWDISTPGNCEYSALDGSQITSVFVNGSLTTYALPSVTVQPGYKTIAKGQNTSFGITATGSGLSYLWQISINGGGIWTDLTNTAPYSGVTTPTMSITNAQLSLSGYQYRCKVSGTCLPVVFSNAAILTVLPNVITTCQTVTSCPGPIVVPLNVTDFIGVAAFSLTLSFDPSVLTYTGYQNLNAAVSGAIFNANAVNGKVYLTWSNTTAATIANGAVLLELKFIGITGSSTLTWDTQTLGNCEYSDISGLVIFSTFTNGNVTVNQPPSITVHPINKSIHSGGSTSFSISAVGTALSYAWQVSTNGGSVWTNLTNVSPYSGVNLSALTINPTAISMNGYQYRCVVTGTCSPVVNSDAALLTVTQAAITTIAGSISNSCSGNLDIPVNVTNCNNVGSISLVLQFDPFIMTFEGYYSVNSALASGLLAVNQIGNKVMLSWASTTQISIGTGTLIHYKFKTNAGTTTTLAWATQTPGYCEYSDINGAMITSFYTNSSISVASNALIVRAGYDVSIPPGSSVQLNGSVSGGVTPYTYAWTPVTGLTNPAILNPVATPSSTVTYTLQVTGNNGCVGIDPVVVNVVPQMIILNLKTLFEGLYAGSGTMNQAMDESAPRYGSYVADRIAVELHSSVPGNYSTIVYSSVNVPLNIAGMATILVPNTYTGSYYITVRHRNSIETTTALPVLFNTSTLSYDFTNAENKAYGSNLKNIGGYFCIYSGDVNQDGLVDSSDLISVDNDASTFVAGYVATDVNGDGLTDSSDLIMVDNNSGSFIGSILP